MLAKLAFTYSTTIFVVINGIILVPHYLTFFDMATYGAWLASGNVIALLGLLDGGLTAVTAQRMAVRFGAGDAAGFARAAGTGLILVGTVSAVMVVGSLSLAPWLPAWVKASPDQHRALTLGIVLAAAGSGMGLFKNSLVKVADAWQRTVFVGVESIISLAAGLAAVLAALAGGLGVAAMGLGLLTQGVVGLALEVPYVAMTWRRQSLPRPSATRSEGVALLRTTAPMFVGKFTSTALGSGESLIVALFISPAAAAVLALTGRVYSVAHLLINPIQGSAYSALAHLAGSQPLAYQRPVTGEICQLVGGVSALIIGTAVAMNRSFLGLWVGPSAYAGPVVDVALCLATVLGTQVLLALTLIMAFGELRKAGWLGIVDGAIRVTLIVSLLPLLGVLGMPLAMSGSILVVLALTWNVLRRYFGQSVSQLARFVLPAWLPLLAALPPGVAYLLFVPPASSWVAFGGQTALVASVLLALILLTSPLMRRASRNPAAYLRAGWRAP